MKILLLLVLIPFVAFADPFEPERIRRGSFAALVNHSPFNRVLMRNDSLIITGFATVDNQQVVTLLNRESKETYVVSASPNSQGWRLLELNRDDDLEKVSARIAMAGEIVPVRYEKHEIKAGQTRPGAGVATGDADLKAGEAPRNERDGKGKGKGGKGGKGGGREGKGKGSGKGTGERTAAAEQGT